MNWGYKILFVYAIFVTGILFMVFKSSTQKMDLVTTDYYAKELKYQDKIDEANRVNALSEKVQYQLINNQVIISFPKDFAGKKITGNVLLYCTADENKDIKKDFAIKDEPLKITITPANKGLHELHISWQVDDLAYYYENKIML
jgi:hypothetical protein